MKPGDAVRLEIPWPLPDWCNTKALENWKQTVLDVKNSDNKEAKILIRSGMGFLVETFSGIRFYVTESWIKPCTDTCECSSRDLLTFGHRCGKKAPIDR